jgi:hypothetical protein
MLAGLKEFLARQRERVAARKSARPGEGLCDVSVCADANVAAQRKRRSGISGRLSRSLH